MRPPRLATRLSVLAIGIIAVMTRRFGLTVGIIAVMTRRFARAIGPIAAMTRRFARAIRLIAVATRRSAHITRFVVLAMRRFVRATRLVGTNGCRAPLAQRLAPVRNLALYFASLTIWPLPLFAQYTFFMSTKSASGLSHSVPFAME
jgi:hypothetical protein